MEEEKRISCATLEKTIATLASQEEKDYIVKCAKMAEKFAKESTAKEFMMSAPPSKAAADAIKYFVEGQFPDRFTVTPKGRFPNRCPTITRMSDDEAELFKSRQAVAKSRRVSDFVGFRSLYKTMVESKKPVIGHSFLADVLFTIAAFDEDLGGAELCKGKQAILERFPVIFDTKAISFDERFFSLKRFAHRSLENLADLYMVSPANPQVKVTLPLGFQNYEQETLLRAKQGGVPSAAHEAGYDALMTGIVWLNLLAEAKVLDSSKFTPETFDAAVDDFLAHARAEFGNKIYLHRSLYTIDLDNNTNVEREQLVEGGGNDIFNAADDGVLHLTYPKTVAPYDVESKIHGMGFQGTVLEIEGGISAMKLEVEKCRAKVGSVGRLNELVSKAIAESNLGSLITAKPFFPYHLRRKHDGVGVCKASPPDAPAAAFQPLPSHLSIRPSNPTAMSYCYDVTYEQKRQYSSVPFATHGAGYVLPMMPATAFKPKMASLTRLLLRRR